jgi:hypothetical protein
MAAVDASAARLRRFNASRSNSGIASRSYSVADECWFCLSNPNIAKHLIVAVGNECYLTLPKGQLIPTHGQTKSRNDGISSVPGGGHVLIVPIAHFPTLASASRDIADSVTGEVDR